MAINDKIKVAVIGAANKSILLNPKATEGAVFGKDLFFGDGKTVVTLQSLATALGITKQSAQPVVLWNQLAAIPPNVIQVANLSTAGVVRRLPNGTWITQPPTDFLGRPGPPGRRGHRGPPGIPGLKGASGLAGSAGTMMPARRGPRGKQGFPGTPGARGATGPQGPSGSGTSASGFPGYRQRPVPKPRLTPWTDRTAANIWSAPQTFNMTTVFTSPAGTTGLRFKAASGSFASMQFTGGLTGTKSWELVVDNSVAGTFSIFNDTHSSEMLAISDVGQFVFAAPNTSTVTLRVNSVDNQSGIDIRSNANTNGTGMQILDLAGTAGAFLGIGAWAFAGAAIGDFTLSSVSGVTRIIGSSVQLRNAGGEVVTFSGAATTGAFAATFAAANKPGLATSPSVGRWLPVMFGGTQFYIPMWQ